MKRVIAGGCDQKWFERKSLIVLILLAPQVGLEPTTLRLTAECSAIELLRSVQAGQLHTVPDFTANPIPCAKNPIYCDSLITASAARLPEANAPWMEAVSR
jgi:hypothetical protein